MLKCNTNTKTNVGLGCKTKCKCGCSDDVKVTQYLGGKWVKKLGDSISSVFVSSPRADKLSDRFISIRKYTYTMNIEEMEEWKAGN